MKNLTGKTSRKGAKPPREVFFLCGFAALRENRLSKNK